MSTITGKRKRIRLKYGMEAYVLYWYCLDNVSRNNLTFAH